jgi:hypothetical protein
MFSAERLQRVVLLMVVLSVFTFSFIVEVHAAPDLWSIVIPDIGGRVGFYPSLALNPNGYPHISYCNVENSGSWTSIDLKYARWTGSEWAIETVDDMGWTDVGWGEMDTSLALDTHGYPHISYTDHAYQNLKYARWTGSEWAIETIDSDDDTGFYPSLALDSNDYPHISYYDMDYGNLKYARWIGDQWNINTIDSGGIVGAFTSLALDSSDNPHISYYDSDGQDLKYAQWSGTYWSINLVDSGGTVGLYTSLALDSSDSPHISYYDYDTKDLKYARWSGTQWSYAIVDSNGIVGKYTSLALDSSDSPHISYFDDTNDALKYAQWRGTVWTTDTVDSVGTWGGHSSLALDTSNHPHIGYYDSSIEVLKYARAPDEYFSDIIPIPFDDNGDGFDDAVEVAMDVDTTYSGALTVHAYILLLNSTGDVVSRTIDPRVWSITGTDVDYGDVSLYTLPRSTPGWYDLEFHLYDGDDNSEDDAYWSEAVYLYPPDMNPSINSCTSLEVQTDSFELEETIYMMGTGYAPSTSFPVYVVVDTTWTDGMTIPSRVVDTATFITSNTGGDIEASEVWSSPLNLGKYDVVVDVNGNGVYDEGVDALDDSDLEVTAGVVVIPEFPVAMLLPVLAGISLIAALVKKRLLPS